MPSLREYDVKLASLKNTQKMTRTMKMVSASKLNKAQEAQRNASRYANQLNEMISRLAASVESAAHPLLERRTTVRNALVLVFTSDKGLCAGFNNNLIKFVEKWRAANAPAFDKLEFSFVGRRGYDYFKNRADVCTYYEGVASKFTALDTLRIARDLRESFLDGRYDEVFVVYNEFFSVLSQKPSVRKLLPIEPLQQHAGIGAIRNYLFEPGEKELLALLLPKTVDFQLYFCALQNAAGEHGARMTAMDNATNNADKLIEDNTLLRNRARQAAITTELIEIISGAEAL